MNKVVGKILLLIVCLAFCASTARAVEDATGGRNLLATYKSCDNYGQKVPTNGWADRRRWSLCCNGNFYAFAKKVTGKKCTKLQLNPPKPQPVPAPKPPKKG